MSVVGTFSTEACRSETTRECVSTTTTTTTTTESRGGRALASTTSTISPSKPTSLHIDSLQQQKEEVLVVDRGKGGIVSEESIEEEETALLNNRDDQSTVRRVECTETSPRQPSSPDRELYQEKDDWSVESVDSKQEETVDVVVTANDEASELDLNECEEEDSSLQRELPVNLIKPQLLVCVDEVEEVPLTKLENVTAQSRSLIPPELLNTKKYRHKRRVKMTNPTVSNSTSKRRGIFRKRNSSSKKRTEKRDDAAQDSVATPMEPPIPSRSQSVPSPRRAGREPTRGRRDESHRYSSLEDEAPSFGSEETPVKSNATKPPRPNIVQRIRSASRSRSRSRSRKSKESEVAPILVAVTSCRSDAYYNQKAPGSTSKLPRKAPSNLKLFHELAVGVKDAYAAVGETPTRPDEEEGEGKEGEPKPKLSPLEFEGRMVLWEFMGNLDFLLALVDEVAIDTATRGALKDDTTFKCLRDVIKKCNKILEGMLVRRERRYTLFIRLVQPTETKDISSMKSWNAKVEKAVGAVAEGRAAPDENETASDTSASTSASSTSGRSGMFSRGRQLLPSAGRVRARRATPTPALRKKRGKQNAVPDAVAAEDGYSAVTTPVTQGNLAMLQRSLAVNNETSQPVAKMGMPAPAPPKQQLAPVKPMEPKDELVDVIRGLHVEKMNRTKEGTAENDLATLKPNWQPKADIPTSVPKLPIEYIHRHRLMKQVVSCLLERSGAGPRDTDEEVQTNAFITSITSRHGDKPGNGKTTLAVASIQTVEVRERFSDGIAWLQLGRKPLNEKDIRRLYEELYRQLVMKDSEDEEDDDDDASSKSTSDKPLSRQSSFASLDKIEKNDDNNTVRYSIFGQLAESRRRFHSGDLDGIKEDLGRILSRRKVLICLDDVWRVEDAKWFIFDTKTPESEPSPAQRRNFGSTPAEEPHPYRILLTTRTPSLLGAGVVQEVFVRIFSEPEAVKLLLSSAGRRPYGGKNSAVFNQARVIVKGCGNSPLAVRLAGGMLRRSNRNWNLSSPTWTALMKQCKLNLDEASRLRSFINSASRVVDLSFMTIQEAAVRAALRRCFVIFAMAFHDNDWVLLGRGIPQAVVLKLFGTVISAEREEEVSPQTILSMLEALNLLERARHGCTSSPPLVSNDDDSPNTSMDVDEAMNGNSGHASDSFRDVSSSRHGPRPVIETPSFVMQDSIKAIAEEMAKRHTPSFLPTPDEFTSFTAEIDEEKKVLKTGSMWSAPWRYLTLQLSSGNGQNQGMEERQVHELVVASMLGIRGSVLQVVMADAYAESREWTMVVKGGDKMEEYMGAFVPTHLIQAEAYSCAVDLLVDPHFISRRVAALGAIEATRRHVADLLELRRVVGKSPPGGHASLASPKKSRRSSADADSHVPGSPSHAHDPPLTPNSPDSPTDSNGPETTNIDAVAVMREGSRRIIDEVYRVANASSGSSDSLTMAICLSSVGEGLLKCRQPRDAMLRLEEAVGIYRGLLGPFHIEVARSLHSVAKALVKLGETRVALLKFGEAARIYESCNATLHFDSIANAQNMASLLVELGEWGKAEEKFEEVISMKKAVYGEANASVAKAINSYAILLAKHGRMNEALRHYEASKATYAAVQPSAVRDPEFELKCTYDVTLINLNIASIKSKKGDLQGAIDSYEEGVRGLREHEEAQKALESATGDVGKSHSHNKHLVAALGRIGSLKLKLGDIEGALEMYVTLLNEVDDNSPTASRTEKAKAHIKCATIYRQLEGKDAHIKSISHLREALEMYTMLFGPEHKDTQAIASSLRQWLTEDQS